MLKLVDTSKLNEISQNDIKLSPVKDEKDVKELVGILDKIALHDYDFDGEGQYKDVISLTQMLKVISEAFKGSKYRFRTLENEEFVKVWVEDITTKDIIFYNDFNYLTAIVNDEVFKLNKDGNLKNKKHFLMQAAASYFTRIITAKMFNIDANETENKRKERIKEEGEMKSLKIAILDIDNTEETIAKTESAQSVGELLELKNKLKKEQKEKQLEKTLKPFKEHLKSKLNEEVYKKNIENETNIDVLKMFVKKVKEEEEKQKQKEEVK